MVNATGSALTYSTYLGGAGNDQGFGIAIDSSGAAYVVGSTLSSNYPTTAGAYDTSYNGGQDAFVTKLNAAGSAFAYSTYLGGITGVSSDSIAAVAVDAAGAGYVVGLTSSIDFPTTIGAYDTSANGSLDAFATKLNAAGSALVYSTFLGGAGDDTATAVALDASGAVYVTGSTSSSDFPTTAGAFDTTFNGLDGFVTKLDASGSNPAYSTFVGGASGESISGIAVDASGAVYVTGYTISTDYPVTAGAFDTTFNGATSNYDAFATKLNAAGSALVYSTFLGGAGDDTANAVALDASGAVYVTGSTSSSDFPTTAGAFDTSYNGGDAFLVKINPTGTGLVYSTFLGAGGANAVAVDASGAAYATGSTLSASFPTTAGAFDTTFNGGLNTADTFVTKVNAAGSGLLYSTFLGVGSGNRIVVDAVGAAYVTGTARSASYPATDDAYDASLDGSEDAFVTKLNVAGSALLHSTFLGGSANDSGTGLAVSPVGAVYVSGTTRSMNFPTTSGAFDADFTGLQDGFVLYYCIGDHAQPNITTQPLDKTIDRGQMATLSVTATSPVGFALSYQWYRGESGFTSDPLAGKTNSTLVTPPLQSTTKFWCRVTDACGVFRDSASATVTVLRAPVPVSNANDSGAGSLRAAIVAANGDPGTDTITFNLSAPYTITVATALPQITEVVVIDGLSQTGSAAGRPLVVLAGPGAGAGQANCADDAAAVFDGLHFASTAAGSVVRGVVINGMPGDGIEFQGGGDAGHQSLVQSCFVGTNAAGNAAVLNGRHGIYLNNAAYAIIGGGRAADGSLLDGCLISGNHCSGIEIKGGLAANNVVIGSNVGPDVTGHFPIGNGIGIEIDGAPNTVVGAAGDVASKRNVCGFNMGAGTNTTGNINTKLGGTSPPNTVVLGTTFTGNGGGAIVGGANYMVGLTAATLNATTLSVTGTATVPANRQYRVQYFSSTTCSATGGQGEVLIAGDVLKQSTPGGVLDLGFSSAATTVRPGELVAVTVTGTEGTSNFSSCQIVTGRLGVVAEQAGQVMFMSLPVSGTGGAVEQGTPGSGSGGTPGLDRTFAGPRDPDDPNVSGDEIVPPDPQAAVGPDHLVAVTNAEIVVAAKTDGNVARRVPLDTMWAGLVRTPTENLFAFNPRATYDTLAGHFIIVATANPSATNSAVLVAISKTTDALGQWNVYRYDAEGADVLWADYPTLGFTKDWIAIQVNMSSIAFANVIVRSEIYLIDKMMAYTGSPGTGKATVVGRATNDGNFGATQMPALTYDAAASTLWLAQTGAGNSGDVGTVRLYMVTGAVGSEVLSTGPFFATASTWFTNPAGYADLAPQQGNDPLQKIQVNDTRMQAVVFRNGHLYLAHTILLPAVNPNRSAVQWWELVPSGGGTFVQRGRVDSGVTTDMTAHPSLAVSASGAIVLGYSHFTSTGFASSAYRFRTAADAAGSLRGEVVLKSGEALYVKRLGGPYNRWGDYSSATIDPSDPERFWLLGEYAETPRTGTATTDQWGVWWGSTAGSGACTVGCPSNIVTQTGVGAGSCGKVVTYPAPTVTGGACGTVTCTPASGSTFAKGTTTVTCSDGASHSCSFTVTVQDNTVPTITCPAPRTVAAGANCQAAAPDLRGLATASDNCAGVVVTQSPVQGTLLGLGTTTVTLTATDAAGNTASCNTTVTVADQTGPQISCPPSILKDAAANACTARVDMQFSVADNCPGAITVVTSPPSGSSFAVGTTTVTITATDVAGNVSTCQTTVNVRDVTAPQMGACPANIQTVALVGASRVVTFARPTATDACSATVTCSPDTGSTFAVGTTTVTCTATDASSNQSSCSFTVTVAPLGSDTAGIYVPSTGAWFLKNANGGGAADLVFGFGPAGVGLVALRGDWNGDGTDTPGLYDSSTGNFFLKNTSSGGPADIVFSFGAGGAGVIPVVGDFNGDGVDTVGIYIQATGAFFLKNTNAPGPGDVVFSFGPGGTDVVPVFGDYDGNGTDTVGIYTPTSGFFFLKNANGGGAADVVFGFGPTGAGIEPVVGDYDGNGTDTVGVYISSTGAWFLKNTNAGGGADVVFSFGPSNVKPLIGDWNGQ
jgi:hypothetical protein